MNEDALTAIVVEELEPFELFTSPTDVNVAIKDDDRFVTFATAFPHWQGTCIMLHMQGDVCYLPTISVEERYRGQGHGRALYGIVEKIAERAGCTRVRMTPSGSTPDGTPRREYLLRLGYKPFGSKEVEKVLK